MDKKARLKHYQKQYQELANNLANLGFIWRGNLQRRMLPCKNKNCDCITKGKPKLGPIPIGLPKSIKKPSQNFFQLKRPFSMNNGSKIDAL